MKAAECIFYLKKRFVTTMRHIQYCFVIVMLLVNLMSCTSSPLGNNEISGGNLQIIGKVELNDGFNAEEVYIWLEGFNVGTRTDSDGGFILTIPSPAGQETPGGISGVFDLYFFIANYTLISVKVAARDGAFIYSQGQINNKGQLIEPVIMNKLLDINTIVKPSAVPFLYQSPVEIDVCLQAVKEPVTVIFRKPGRPLSSQIFLRSIETGPILSWPSFNADSQITDEKIILKDSLYIHKLLFNPAFSDTTLPSGKYEVIPYFLIKNKEIPFGLIESLGESVEEPGQNYLKIPFIRNGGNFVIQN